MTEILTVPGASITATSEGIYYDLEAADITLNALGNDTIESYGQRNYITVAGGDNSLGNGARDSTIEAGAGDDYLIFNGSNNGFDLGDGSNTVDGVVLKGTEYDQYADFNDNNTLLTGDGADSITVTGDENWIYAGAGADTLIIEGNGNLILSGYPLLDEDDEDYEPPSEFGDDDIMTVRGDVNLISGGTGLNVLELEGSGNYYTGAGSDTVRAVIMNSSIDGAVDVEVEGDGNAIEMIGGRLILSGDDALISLTGGANATVTGKELTATVDNSRLSIEGLGASLVASGATLDATTLTSALVEIEDELTLNGRLMKGKTTLELLNGSLRAVAEDTPLEGYEGVWVKFDGEATIDGVMYTRITVPAYANTDDGNAIVVKDREITNLGWNEGLHILTEDRYTVNGYEFEVTPDDALVGTNDWAGLLSFNLLDDVEYYGTEFNDNMINDGADVTIDSGAGEDYVSLSSDAREFIVFDGEGTIEVDNFETGFDELSDVMINGVYGYDWHIDFGITGVNIRSGDSVMQLINSGYESVDFLLQNDDALWQVTALNEGATAAALEAEYYFLNAGSTLYAEDNVDFMINGIALPDEYLIGSTVIGGTVSSDYEFTAFDVLSPTKGEYTVRGIMGDAVIDSVDASGQIFAFDGAATVNNYNGAGILEGLQVATDGRVTVEIADHEVKSILGLDAGEGVTVGSTSYIVSDDGASIRNQDGGLMWTGAEVAAVNVLELDEIIDDTTSEAPSEDTTSTAPIDDTTSTAPVDDTTSTAPIDDTTSTAPVDDTTSTAPVDDTTSTAPVDDTTSTAPVDDTTSTAPVDDTTSVEVVDSSTFIDNSVDDIDETLTSAKVGIIEEEARGNKILTAGSRSTTLANYASAVDVTFFGSPKNDSIVAGGGTQLIDISNGGRDTLDVRAGTVNVFGYDATTNSAFLVDGEFVFDGDGFSSEGLRVILDENAPRGRFANFVDGDGTKQLYGWNYEGSVIDGSNYQSPQHLISEGWSTLKGGAKDDTIDAKSGDVVQLSQGHDLIVIEAQASQEVTIDLGTHLSHSTVEGFDSNDIVKVDDVTALKVKDTDDGLMLRAGKAHLTLAGVSDTVRITDGNSEFVLHTDYSDLVPTAAYLLEDEDGIIRTPNGSLEIDDDIFTFNGGADVAINGFDESWQLRAGDGIEIERVTTLVNGTVKFTSNGGSIKLRK